MAQQFRLVKYYNLPIYIHIHIIYIYIMDGGFLKCGYPKSSIYRWLFPFFHPFWGTPMYGNPYHCTPIIRPYLPGGATEGTCLGRYSRELMWLPWDLMGYEWDLIWFNGIEWNINEIKGDLMGFFMISNGIWHLIRIQWGWASGNFLHSCGMLG